MKSFKELYNLQDCPFCGGEHLLRAILITHEKPNPMKVKCAECNFEMKEWQNGMALAAKDWNEAAEWMKYGQRTVN